MELKSPNRPEAKAAGKASGSQTSQDVGLSPSQFGGLVQQALAQEASLLVMTTDIQMGLRRAARAYLDSGKNAEYLPEEPALRRATEILAGQLDASRKTLHGKFYFAPAVSEVQIPSPQTINVSGYFQAVGEPRRLAGGN